MWSVREKEVLYYQTWDFMVEQHSDDLDPDIKPGSWLYTVHDEWWYDRYPGIRPERLRNT